MRKKTFNPADWPSQNSISNPNPAPARANLRVCPNPTASDLETIASRIEFAAVDIAPGYADWRDLGFALADALGENGRDYYHRLSRFYPNYSPSENRQAIFRLSQSARPRHNNKNIVSFSKNRRNRCFNKR